MFFNNNDFAGTGFGRSTFDNNTIGVKGYPFEVTNDKPSTSGSDPDAALNGLSNAEIEEWWLGPRSDGDVNQYAGSTLPDPSGGFAGPYDDQTGYVPGPDSGESCRCLSPSLYKELNANSNPR